MARTLVQFLWFEGCPLATRAREALIEALQQLDKQIKFQEIDLLAASTTDELKRWGSPTILINGRDITGASPGGACNCRIYQGPGGVPAVQDIVDALRNAD
jgi:hypothetical protein